MEALGGPRRIEMFGLIAFFAVVVLLIVAAGLPYPQSWYGRWGNSDR
jgi:hypothetical protein